GLLELLEQLFLLGRQVGRRLDGDLDVHVAALGRAHDRHALGAQPELVAALRARRDVDARRLAVERRHLDRAAERRLHHRDRHLAVHVRSLALEQRVAAHRQEDIEIARRPAAGAGLALAAEANAGAVLDAGRDVDLERLLAAHAALAGADLARLVDHLSGAVAGRAGALDGEEALLGADAAAAVAGRALVRFGAGLGARAVAGLAGDRARDAHRGLGAAIGLLQRDLEIEAQVLAAHVGASTGTLPAPAAVEHLLEDVAEHRAEVEALRIEAARPAGAVATLEGGGAVAVVGRALVGILQDVVGVVDLLELLFSFLLVVPIAIGVMLHGELAEGLLDVVGARRPTDAQQLVIVLRHGPLRVPRLRCFPKRPASRRSGRPFHLIQVGALQLPE